MEIKDIKFKAKRLDNGEWVCGYFYEENGNTYIIENRQKESMLNRNVTCEVDPSTVCQFTGLKDCEGKEIWEHDLLCSQITGAIYEVFMYKTVGFMMKDFVSGRYFPDLLGSILQDGKFKVVDNKFNSR